MRPWCSSSNQSGDPAQANTSPVTLSITIAAAHVVAQRDAGQVLLEDLALGQRRFETQGEEHLGELGANAARVRTDQPRELHAQGRSPLRESAAPQVFTQRARERERIDAGV